MVGYINVSDRKQPLVLTEQYHCNSCLGFKIVCTQILFYLLNIIMTSLSGTAVALMFSASTTQHSIGALLLALVYVCMMVFSGRMVNIDTVPVWLRWLKWISIFRYSLNVRTSRHDTRFVLLREFSCCIHMHTQMQCLKPFTGQYSGCIIFHNLLSQSPTRACNVKPSANGWHGRAFFNVH